MLYSRHLFVFDLFVVCIVLLLPFCSVYKQTHCAVIITVIDECKHLHIILLHFHIFTFVTCVTLCACAGSSLEVKIETDSNDAMEIKTEADDNDIAEHLHGDRPSHSKFIQIFIP